MMFTGRKVDRKIGRAMQPLKVRVGLFYFYKKGTFGCSESCGSTTHTYYYIGEGNTAGNLITSIIGKKFTLA